MSAPTSPFSPSPSGSDWTPLVCVVDFHHARGPEVERWFGVEEGFDPAVAYDWGLLPFMALSDGAHALTEEFSYFTLLRPSSSSSPATSLFGIACTRQIDASQLIHRPADVTRSTVQKAVVVIADSPAQFGMLRERLSVVTKAWFAQREFGDVEILKRFQESLVDEAVRDRKLREQRGNGDGGGGDQQHLGLSLRELVRQFRWQTLVLLKAALLQPKMLFFGTRCERLCLTQFSLISLIPGLLRNLQDSAGPELHSYEQNLKRPEGVKTSDRSSLLAYMGFPLQIFGKGSLFGPYTPLQQLDLLADFGTKSYIVGSTNSLLLQQKDRYSDILINLDEGTINITSPSLRTALSLSTPDRRWIDFITQNVNDTWDDANPSRPKTMGYAGSEEFIRLQFEEYLLSLASCVKYRAHLAKHANNPRMLLPEIEGDPSTDFNNDFIEAWQRTDNYRIWNSFTDSHLFDIVEPRHPCAGGLTLEDIQRRLAQQVQDLHLDERFAQSREVLGRSVAAGKEKASSFLNRVYAEMEAFREGQRKKAEEAAKQKEGEQQQGEKQEGEGTQGGGPGFADRAGAFVSGWAAWGKSKWSGGGGGGGGGGAGTASSSTSEANNAPSSSNGSSSTAGGWTSWGRGHKSRPSSASLLPRRSQDTVRERSERDSEDRELTDKERKHLSGGVTSPSSFFTSFIGRIATPTRESFEISRPGTGTGSGSGSREVLFDDHAAASSSSRPASPTKKNSVTEKAKEKEKEKLTVPDNDTAETESFKSAQEGVLTDKEDDSEGYERVPSQVSGFWEVGGKYATGKKGEEAEGTLGEEESRVWGR